MRTKIHRLVPYFAIALLAGCASGPPPTGLLDRADAQIRAARDAGAAASAPDDFAEARRRQALAQSAASNGKNDEAADLAEEAEAAAETARVRARAADIQAQIQAKVDENSRLQADLEQKESDAAAQSAAAQAPASGASAEELPPIQLGTPAPAASSGAPMPAGSAGDMLPPEPPAPANGDGQPQNDHSQNAGGSGY